MNIVLALVVVGWAAHAEVKAFEDVQECIRYAAPGEYSVECEYMISDHRALLDSNPHGRKLTNEEWDSYWAYYARKHNTYD